MQSCNGHLTDLAIGALHVYSSRTVSRIDEFWHFLHQITLNLYNFYTQPRGSDYLSTLYFTQANSKTKTNQNKFEVRKDKQISLEIMTSYRHLHSN